MPETDPDDDVGEALQGPSAADADEALAYWRRRERALPRRRRAARREARAMVVAWEERVRAAELERWGGGWLGRAAGRLAVLRTMSVAAGLRSLVPRKLVAGALALVVGTLLLAAIVIGAIVAALL